MIKKDDKIKKGSIQNLNQMQSYLHFHQKSSTGQNDAWWSLVTFLMPVAAQY